MVLYNDAIISVSQETPDLLIDTFGTPNNNGAYTVIVTNPGLDPDFSLEIAPYIVTFEDPAGQCRASSDVSGIYTVVNSAYYRQETAGPSAVFEWNGEPRVITTGVGPYYSHGNFYGAFTTVDDFLFLVNEDNTISIPDTIDGEQNYLWSGDDWLSCEDDYESFNNVPCDGSNVYVEDLQNGNDTLRLTYGYVWFDGNNPGEREYYEELVRKSNPCSETYNVSLPTCDPDLAGQTIPYRCVGYNYCDSITNVTYFQSDAELYFEEVFSCDESEIGIMVDTFPTPDGCDSVVQTTVSLYNSYYIIDSLQTIDSTNTGVTIDSLVSADGCDSIIQTVLTFELIEVEFEFTDLGDNRFAFQNTTTGTRDFLWDFGDGNTSTEENPTHQYSTFGTFEVILTAINSSGEAVSMTLIINVVNANQLLEFATFEIYPNPTSGNLSVNLEYRDCAGALLGRILDVSGRALTTFQIDCFERTEHVLDLNHLEHGIYILELSDKNRLAAGSRIFLIQD